MRLQCTLPTRGHPGLIQAYHYKRCQYAHHKDRSKSTPTHFVCARVDQVIQSKVPFFDESALMSAHEYSYSVISVQDSMSAPLSSSTLRPAAARTYLKCMQHAYLEPVYGFMPDSLAFSDVFSKGDACF